MLFLFEFMVEIPPSLFNRKPRERGVGRWYNLTAIGACWIFVESAASRRQADYKDKPALPGNVARPIRIRLSFERGVNSSLDRITRDPAVPRLAQSRSLINSAGWPRRPQAMS